MKTSFRPIAQISLATVLCGHAAVEAQTNLALPSVVTTNAVSTNAAATNITVLGNATVVGHLEEERSAILPSLGVTAYSMDQKQILSTAQGENAQFNQLILRAPGVTQDSAANGDLHVRGEHANLQYRINGIILPEGVSGFGLELDPRFVQNFQLITGALPAEYGFRTAGVVDIQTKNGGQDKGGEVGVYGGSFDTVRPFVEYGGTQGQWSFFGDASYEHNALGIENTTGSSSAIHDDTEQYKSFLYGSYVIDDTSRLTLMGSASYSSYQIPNTPGLGAFTAGPVPGIPFFDSTQLDENQSEQNYFGVAAYQKSAGNFNMQLSAFGRASEVHFEPDLIGDLYLNGVASDVGRDVYAGGLQLDASYELGDKHTLRGGFQFLDEYAVDDALTRAFYVDSTGAPTGLAPDIVDNHSVHGYFAGAYLQDEWKILPKVTLNYGARFDQYYSESDKENQPSPRVNAIYQPTTSTTVHAGYARYFTPPPTENTVTPNFPLYAGTTASPAVTQADPVKSERANYFDTGVTQKIIPGLKLGVDGYYKSAHNQLDDGLFGQTLILDSFNYAQADIYGIEFTASYDVGGFSTYANLAYSVARGKDWDSSEYLFDPAALAYVRNNSIYLDHDQRLSGSFGASYAWKEHTGTTRVYIDSLYGSGLREDLVNPDGSVIPNGASVPSYYSVNIGAEQLFKWHNHDRLRARLDIVNVTDHVYELRNGTGVGVNAPQFGMRRGFFGTLSYLF
jgi:outer membrane receptor protein involved in Fe transport